MPASEISSRAFARTSSSCRTPIVARIGAVAAQATAGWALCATTQIEQGALSVCVGWLWTDSAAAIHNIKDRHSQADHRVHDCILTYESVQDFICRNESNRSRTILVLRH
jgi:hypothetical protein